MNVEIYILICILRIRDRGLMSLIDKSVPLVNETHQDFKLGLTESQKSTELVYILHTCKAQCQVCGGGCPQNGVDPEKITNSGESTAL